MKDIDTCKLGLTRQCPEIANPITLDFLKLVRDQCVTIEAINAINELCEKCTAFTPKESVEDSP